jgi:predicted Zn-dependent protease
MEKSGNKNTDPLMKSLSDAFSTHPPSEERVKQMRELVEQSPDRNAIINTQEFNRAKQIAASMKKK